MSEGYSIEIADELVGIVVRGKDERVFRFHSAVKEYKALDGHRFAKPEAAERAAREHAARRRLKAFLIIRQDDPTSLGRFA